MADADVLIVGAGPAGASLATWLGARGRRVLLLDRARFPREAVCGEAISPGARAALAALDVAEAVEAAGAWPYHGVRLVAADGAIAEARYPAGAAGLSLPRHALDELLVRRAGRVPGVEVREGVRVAGLLRDADGACAGVRLESGPTVTARVVVAADGRRSALRREWLDEAAPPPARRFCFLTTFTGGDRTDALMECGLPAPGLQYVRVCQGPGRHALCLVVDDATREAEAAGTAPGFARLVAGIPRLAAILAGTTPGPMRGMPLAPYGARRLVGDGMLLVGDATGYMDPITGEGMYRAFTGAALAAEAIDAALEGPGAVVAGARLAGYERSLRLRFEPVVAFVEHAVRFTTLPSPLSGALIRVLGAAPPLATAVAAVQGALMPPEDLARPWRWPAAPPAGPPWTLSREAG